jgi:NADPH2:quinone reductase
MKAVRIHRYGGLEALQCEDVPVPEPGRSEARVKLEAIGVNFIDIYHRTGLYPNPLPFTPGMEGAGVVDSVGEGVTEIKAGDRVAYAMELGSYAEQAVVPAWRLVPIPPALDSRSAGAAMLQGLTAHYLTHSTYPLKKGDTALIHAAAGGVGLLLVQIAKHLGATVIGTVSTDEKARLARDAGADEVIVYTRSDFAVEVKRLTQGSGVNVVYDSVGQTTFDRSLDCLTPRGSMVLFGQSSGPVPAFNLGSLAAKGSLFVTRPTLVHYLRSREELLQRATDILRWIVSDELKLRIDETFSLTAAGEAQRRLESRQTTGKLLLIP